MNVLLVCFLIPTIIVVYWYNGSVHSYCIQASLIKYNEVEQCGKFLWHFKAITVTFVSLKCQESVLVMKQTSTGDLSGVAEWLL